MNISKVSDITNNETVSDTLSTRQASINKSFADTLQSASSSQSVSLEDIFNQAAETYDVDVNLLKAIARQESNFQTDAVSAAGAQGIMQLMPQTAKAMGVTDAMDPEQNIMGGAKLISKLLNQYDGDVSLSLAAYNAGTGNVAKYNGIPPFTETQNYVKNVMSYYQNGVDVPNTTVSGTLSTSSNASALYGAFVNDGTTPETSSPDESLLGDSNDSIFSYQDYLRFLDIYLSLLEKNNEIM